MKPDKCGHVWIKGVCKYGEGIQQIGHTIVGWGLFWGITFCVNIVGFVAEQFKISELSLVIDSLCTVHRRLTPKNISLHLFHRFIFTSGSGGTICTNPLSVCNT